ncbi:MAG: hypothetical protein OEW46_09035 [Actinomycetota bacterium]|nr:hypothetical protein [Actinomycetota bacterium]
MDTEKLSYPGIAGAVAGVVGLAGVYVSWFQISGPSGTLKVDGVADASGTLGLAMSLALFAFSVAYVLMADVPLRRAFAALMTVTAVVLTLSCIWGVARADGADLAFGIYLSGLGGVLGVASGILTLRDAPPDGVIPDEAEAAAS